MLKLSTITKTQLYKALKRIVGDDIKDFKIVKYNGNFKISASVFPVDNSQRRVEKVLVSSNLSNKIQVKGTYYNHTFVAKNINNIALSIITDITARINKIYEEDCKLSVKRIDDFLKPSTKKQAGCLKYYQTLASIKDLVHQIKISNNQGKENIMSLDNIMLELIVMGSDKQYNYLENQITKTRLVDVEANSDASNVAYTAAMLMFGRSIRFTCASLKHMAELGAKDCYDQEFPNVLKDSYWHNLSMHIAIDTLVSRDGNFKNAEGMLSTLNKNPDMYIFEWILLNQILNILLNYQQQIVDNTASLCMSNF